MPPPSRLRAWILAARVKTLPAALVPVAVGTAAARWAGPLRPGLALSCAAFALLVQVATNLANDLYDSERGADGPERLGPLRVTAAGLITPPAMRRALVAVAVAAGLTGLPVALAQPALALAGVASLVAGWAYTGGPFPLAYHGLGDVFVVAFFGVVAVTGSAYAQAGAVLPVAVVAGLGVGLLCDDLLVVNNTRDLPTDAAAGKRTLAVRLGATFCRAQYAAQALAAFVLPFTLSLRTGAVTLLAAPLAIRAGVRFSRADSGPAFNSALGLTAAALLGYGAALTAGLAWR